MKISRFLLLGVAILMTAGIALADMTPGDATVQLRDPDSCGLHCTELTAGNASFSFKINGTGGGIFTFENDLGFAITSLTITIENPATTAGCSVTAFFKNCSASSNSHTGFTTIIFSGVNTGGDCATIGVGSFDGGGSGKSGTDCGILRDVVFSLDFDNNPNIHNGVGGWNSGSSVGAVASPTPEPATLFLMLTGLGPLVGFGRKRWGSKAA